MKGQLQIVCGALALSTTLGVASVASANLYFGPGGAIPDGPGGSVVFTINVGDVGTVSTFNAITLINLAHTWVGDVKVTLTLPDLTEVSIVDRIGVPTTLSGDSSNYNGTYKFADSGFTPLADGNIWTEATLGGSSYNLRTGTYAASGAGSGAAINLNALIAGKSISGSWKLTITDSAGFDTGALGSWSLDFSVVPAPGALALLGLAGLGGRRRRVA